MKFKVKHKAFRFRSDLKSIVLSILAFYWIKFFNKGKALIKIKFYQSYYKEGADQLDWSKAFGSKSGFKTYSNMEEIYAYRYLNDEKQMYQTAIYGRNKEDIFWDDEESGFIFEYQLDLRFWFPVIPWAGGNTYPLVNYEYEIEITKS